MIPVNIRAYCSEDCSALAELFYQTVHKVNAQDYSPQQLAAWANGNVNLAAWNQSFLASHTLIAMAGCQITGFGNINAEGYLDCLYVHAMWQRQGIATALCNRLEAWTQTNCIITHASLTAVPFFQKRGYRIIMEQWVERHDVLLPNKVMKKPLRSRHDQHNRQGTDDSGSRQAHAACGAYCGNLG